MSPLFLALLACSPTPEMPPPADPVAEELLVQPGPPDIGELDLRLPSTAQAHDSVELEFSYRLPDSCWSRVARLDQPEPLAFVYTIDHERRDGVCAQAIAPQVVKISVTPKEAGTLSFKAIIDGAERVDHSFEVQPLGGAAPDSPVAPGSGG